MIEPYILTDTPSVISVGDRAMNKGYSFVWIAGRNPYWITPAGKVITLEVLRDIPSLGGTQISVSRRMLSLMITTFRGIRVCHP